MNASALMHVLLQMDLEILSDVESTGGNGVSLLAYQRTQGCDLLKTECDEEASSNREQNSP